MSENYAYLSWVLCLEPSKVNIKGLAMYGISFECQGLLPWAFRLLEELSSFYMYDWGLSFLSGYWLGLLSVLRMYLFITFHKDISTKLQFATARPAGKCLSLLLWTSNFSLLFLNLLLEGFTWLDKAHPGSSAGKDSACKAGDLSLISWFGRSPGEGIGYHSSILGFLRDSVGKESACNVGDLGLIPGLGWSPGGGHGNLLQYSCLENPHGHRSLVGYSPQGCKESDMTERLSTAQHPHSRVGWLYWMHMPAVDILETFLKYCLPQNFSWFSAKYIQWKVGNMEGENKWINAIMWESRSFPWDCNHTPKYM